MTTESDRVLRHAGYTGSIEVSVEDGCMHGQVLHTHDLITYEGETVQELVEAFRTAVDGYLQHCRVVGKAPDKPYTGSFNVRLGAERHRWLVEAAHARGCKLNEVVCQAVDALRAQADAGPADVPMHHPTSVVSTLRGLVSQRTSHAQVTSWNWGPVSALSEFRHHAFEHSSSEAEAVEIVTGSIAESAGTGAKFFFTEPSIEGHETAGAVLKRLN